MCRTCVNVLYFEVHCISDVEIEILPWIWDTSYTRQTGETVLVKSEWQWLETTAIHVALGALGFDCRKFVVGAKAIWVRPLVDAIRVKLEKSSTLNWFAYRSAVLKESFHGAVIGRLFLPLLLYCIILPHSIPETCVFLLLSLPWRSVIVSSDSV